VPTYQNKESFFSECELKYLFDSSFDLWYPGNEKNVVFYKTNNNETLRGVEIHVLSL
jgi:hypothetical protein